MLRDCHLEAITRGTESMRRFRTLKRLRTSSLLGPSAHTHMVSEPAGGSAQTFLLGSCLVVLENVEKDRVNQRERLRVRLNNLGIGRGFCRKIARVPNI